MAKHRAKDERYAWNSWNNPECYLRELFPERQVLAVIDIEGSQHQDIRSAHAADVKSQSQQVVSARKAPAQIQSRKCQRAQDEEVVVLPPAHSKENAHRDADTRERPEIERAESAMTSPPLLHHHCHRAGDGRHDPKYDVDTNEGQEHRIRGRDRDAKKHGCGSIGHARTTMMMLHARSADSEPSVTAVSESMFPGAASEPRDRFAC
jgi:hypothetical protein